MAQTSVEWLVEIISNKVALTPMEIRMLFNAEEQAKAMHKGEHEKAYIAGGKSIMHGVVSSPEGLIANAEIYYNETFGKKD
jgi:hypothetical protein